MQKQLVVSGMTITHEGRSKSHQTRHNAWNRSFGGSGLSHPHECTSESHQTRPTASRRSFGNWKSSYKLMRIQIHTNPPHGIHCGVLQMVSIIQIKGNLKPTPPSPRRAVVCFELVLPHPHEGTCKSIPIRPLCVQPKFFANGMAHTNDGPSNSNHMRPSASSRSLLQMECFIHMKSYPNPTQPARRHRVVVFAL